MRKLFLDDTRKPPDFTWDIVKSYKEFIAYITLNGVPDIISFDHDLGQEHYDYYGNEIALCIEENGDLAKCKIPYETFTEKTGYDCAKWLVANDLLPKQYAIHSMNPVGAINIKFVLDAGYRNEGTREIKSRCSSDQSEISA
jgi:hypothetical protein